MRWYSFVVNEKISIQPSAGEILTEAMLLPGKVYWVTEDASLRALLAKALGISATINTGQDVNIPFVYPWGERYSKKDRITGSVHPDHTRHIRHDSARPTDPRIVLKGTGLLANKYDPQPGSPQRWHVDDEGIFGLEDKERYMRGLCDISEAVRDRNFALFGNSYGGRFGIPLAILAYQELPFTDQRGNVLFGDIDTLRRVGLIPKQEYELVGPETPYSHRDRDFTQAVCYGRALLSNERLDISDTDPSVRDFASFFVWLVKAQTTNVAVLHGLELSNDEFNSSNMTLGGESVYLSSCHPLE